MHEVQELSGFALPVLVAGINVRQLKNARRALSPAYEVTMGFLCTRSANVMLKVGMPHTRSKCTRCNQRRPPWR